VYSTVQNNLNAVFMPDFIFQVIGLLKEVRKGRPSSASETRRNS